MEWKKSIKTPKALKEGKASLITITISSYMCFFFAAKNFLIETSSKHLYLFEKISRRHPVVDRREIEAPKKKQQNSRFIANNALRVSNVHERDFFRPS
jgi:hypothetical protein